MQKLVYGVNGSITQIYDTKSKLTYIYEYDSLGRLIRGRQLPILVDNNGVPFLASLASVLTTDNRFDEYGRAESSAYVIGDRTLEYSVTEL